MAMTLSIYLLIIYTFYVSSARGSCTNGWVSFHESCYLFVKIAESWPLAEAHCKAIDSDLVAITSSAENTFIKTHLNGISGSKDVYWTSGTDIAETGEWKWSAIHESVEYQDWYPGQPNGGERCLAIDAHTGFSWHDYGCIGSHFFICEAGQAVSGQQVIG